MDEVYLKYYQSQAGNGLEDIGELYHISPKYYQRGRSGVGSFFSGIFRHLKPLISSGLRALKKQSIKTSANIIKDLGEKPIKEIFIEEGRAAVDELAQKGINKELGKNIKRKFPMKDNQSVSIIKKQRTTQRKKIKNKISKKDIFSN